MLASRKSLNRWKKRYVLVEKMSDETTPFYLTAYLISKRFKLDCALCETYGSNCCLCPVSYVDKRCVSEGSAFDGVTRKMKKSDMLAAIKNMIDVLEKAVNYEKQHS